MSQFTIGGVVYNLSAEDVRKTLLHFNGYTAPPPPHHHIVEVEGRRYGVTWALRVCLGLQGQNVPTALARRVFQELGFPVTREAARLAGGE